MMRMKYLPFGCLALLLLLTSCSMILQPTTSFDRRRVASSYGKVLNQTNPTCENCTDHILVKKPDGDFCTVVVRYDGSVRLLQ